MSIFIYILAGFHLLNALAFWWYSMFYVASLGQKFMGLLLTSFCLATAGILLQVASSM